MTMQPETVMQSKWQEEGYWHYGNLKRYFASWSRIVSDWEASNLEWPEYAATHGAKD